MAKPKPKKSKVENPRTGKRATIEFDPSVSPRGKATIKTNPPKATPKTEKTEKPKAEGKLPFTTSEKPKLKDIEKKVLKFLISLDHPATTNEVRDHFHFKLRAPARAIFRRLAALGYGDNRKVGNRYKFFVKGKEYPKPKEEPKKEPEAKAK